MPTSEYLPDDEQRERIAALERKETAFRAHRKPFESSWFMNSAALRGQHYLDWVGKTPQLTLPDAPAHRQRLSINRILPKIRARRSKYLRARNKWVVVPASPDQDDRMNARATQKALDYQRRRLRLNLLHFRAILWTEVCGRGYWWVYWDPDAKGRIRQAPIAAGMKPAVTEATLGDVAIEVGSAFEILIADPTIGFIGDQPEILRVKLRSLADMKARYPDFADFMDGETPKPEDSSYQRRIAALSPKGSTVPTDASERKRDDPSEAQIKVIEYFQAPCAAFPKGRYTKVAGGVLLEDRPELPYDFSDLTNPYPVVEFVDIPQAGQYWSSTLIEQLIPLNREYNHARSRLAEALRAQIHPKLFAAKQHQLPPGCWTSEPNEVIEYIARPGIDKPYIWSPGNVAADVWQSIGLVQREFDDLSQIFPVVEGRSGTTTSGFQANLLQEAAESVHGPDIQLQEAAFEEAAYKIRRLMKQGYTVPRLITVIGSDYQSDAIEFSATEIDESADIIVETASALPDLRYARVEVVTSMFDKGLLGPQQDPDTRRRALNMMEMGTVEDVWDFSRRDIEAARLENAAITEGRPVEPPQFYENHLLHYQIHADQLKAPEVKLWPIPQRQALMAQLLKHEEFINPVSAAQHAIDYGLQGLLKPQTMQAYQQSLMPPPPAPGQPPAGPPQGPPPNVPVGKAPRP
jgi:hypothetical protein